MPLINTASRHDVTVKTAVVGENEKNTPFVELGFENDAGETINGWLYLSPNAFDRSVRTLRDCFGFDNNFAMIDAQVVGKRCSITTEFETYQEKERLKVKWINPLRVVAPLAGGVNALQQLSAAASRVANEAPKAIARPKATPAINGGFPA